MLVNNEDGAMSANAFIRLLSNGMILVQNESMACIILQQLFSDECHLWHRKFRGYVDTCVGLSSKIKIKIGHLFKLLTAPQ